MVSLEQVKLLEAKVAKAIDFVKRLSDENTTLRGKLDGYRRRIDELEVLVRAFKEDQGRIEAGILSALERLNQFEDAVERGLGEDQEKTEPAEEPVADAPAAEEPITDGPVAEAPVIEEAVTETRATEGSDADPKDSADSDEAILAQLEAEEAAAREAARAAEAETATEDESETAPREAPKDQGGELDIF